MKILVLGDIVGRPGRNFLSQYLQSYIEQEEDLVLNIGAIKPIICSFGPETSKTLSENELTVELECANPSIEDMTSRLVKYFS